MAGSAGRLLTELVDGRGVSVWVPSGPVEAIVYAGDGQELASWGADLDEAAAVMIVGTHRAADETVRIQEYSPGESTPAFAFDPERFAAHERFFVETVPSWVRSRFGVDLPPDRTAVLGVSASAELALAMGMRHPDRYPAVLAASPGAGYRPPHPLVSPLPRAYLVAGDREPFFAENARRWADALRDAGADVVMAHRSGAHGGAFWRAELPRMIAWAFGPR